METEKPRTTGGRPGFGVRSTDRGRRVCLEHASNVSQMGV